MARTLVWTAGGVPADEKAADHGFAGSAAAGAGHGGALIGSGCCRGFGQRHQAVDEDQCGDVRGIKMSVAKNHGRAHAVADQDYAIGFHLGAHGLDGTSKKIHGELAVFRGIAMAMAGQIERNHAILLRERGDLFGPGGVVAGIAVHEDDGFGPFAGNGGMNLEAVDAGRGERKRENQTEQIPHGHSNGFKFTPGFKRPST